MAIIDAEGLFNGDRFDDISDAARFAWPYLWCASNTCGRLEINYRKIVNRAFARFRHPPAEPILMGWIWEYNAAFLLFLYSANDGSLWGQWDCSEKMLPTYKYTADVSTPLPPADSFAQWREHYISLKIAKSSRANNFKIFQKVSDYIGVGVGVGVGVGEGKNISSATPAEAPLESLFELESLEPQTADAKQPRRPARSSLQSLQDQWFTEEFWPPYWRKVDKLAAGTEWRKHATSETKKNQIVGAVQAQAPVYSIRDPEHQPYAATWLRKRRYEDTLENLVQENRNNGHKPSANQQLERI